jgi:hypothetical protein
MELLDILYMIASRTGAIIPNELTTDKKDVSKE